MASRPGDRPSSAPGGPLAESLGEPDQAWLRARLEELEKIDRPSASEGERRAAEWLVERFGELGAEARIEAEDAHGTYWWPLGLGTTLGVLGGLLALSGRRGSGATGQASALRGRASGLLGKGTEGRGRRILGAALGAIGAAGIASDFPPHRRRLRTVLPTRTTYNVVCEVGDPDAAKTLVVIAHHDSAHSGLVFHPAIPKIADRLGLIERIETSPALMAPVVGGPLLVALGALTKFRALTKLGTGLAAAATATMVEIGLRKVVPGANDNGTAVVSLLALAKRFADAPAPGVRVVLLSAGAEESFSEGIKAYGDRHFEHLPTDSTFFLCLESTGSPHLLVLRGEGFLKMYDYPEKALELLDSSAAELGIWLWPNLRLHNGTDGLEPLAAGYESAVIASCDRLKQPSNYHWWNDLAENVDFGTVADGIRLSEATIRRFAAT